LAECTAGAVRTASASGAGQAGCGAIYPDGARCGMVDGDGVDAPVAEERWGWGRVASKMESEEELEKKTTLRRGVRRGCAERETRDKPESERERRLRVRKRRLDKPAANWRVREPSG